LWAVPLLAVAGCESEYAHKRLNMRVERMERTVRVWSESEGMRPDRLERDLAFIRQDTELRETRLTRDAQWFVDWQRRAVERFRGRGPVYLDKAGKILWGKPENVERHAITLFY
jgi:hypothetical protein